MDFANTLNTAAFVCFSCPITPPQPTFGAPKKGQPSLISSVQIKLFDHHLGVVLGYRVQGGPDHWICSQVLAWAILTGVYVRLLSSIDPIFREEAARASARAAETAAGLSSTGEGVSAARVREGSRDCSAGYRVERGGVGGKVERSKNTPGI